MPLSHDDVREILRIIDESDLAELHLETASFSLHVSRLGAGEGARSLAPRGVQGAGERVPTPAPPAATPPPAADDGSVTISSPMLGTFYRAESPGAAPFIEVGATVTPDTTVGIIEVMKMMNSVPAGVAGVVAEILADNAALVEYGEPLLRVTPDE